MIDILLIIVACLVSMFIYELGRCFVAKALGIPVISFTIGAGERKIWETRIGDTIYSLALVPIGAHTLIFKGVGEKGEFLFDGSPAEGLGQMMGRPTPRSEKELSLAEELSKRECLGTTGISFYRQALGYLGGTFGCALWLPVAFFLGVYFIIPYKGLSKELIVGSVETNSEAYVVGLREGDLIVSIGDKSPRDWNEVFSYVTSGNAISMKISRNLGERNVLRDINLTPRKLDTPVEQPSGYIQQFEPPFYPKIARQEIGISDAIKLVGAAIMSSFGPEEAKAAMFTCPNVMDENFGQERFTFLIFLTMFSFCVVIINLLPLPFTDGGRLLSLVFGKFGISHSRSGMLTNGVKTAAFTLVLGLYFIL